MTHRCSKCSCEIFWTQVGTDAFTGVSVFRWVATMKTDNRPPIVCSSGGRHEVE